MVSRCDWKLFKSYLFLKLLYASLWFGAVISIIFQNKEIISMIIIILQGKFTLVSEKKALALYSYSAFSLVFCYFSYNFSSVYLFIFFYRIIHRRKASHHFWLFPWYSSPFLFPAFPKSSAQNKIYKLGCLKRFPLTQLWSTLLCRRASVSETLNSLWFYPTCKITR